MTVDESKPADGAPSISASASTAAAAATTANVSSNVTSPIPGASSEQLKVLATATTTDASSAPQKTGSVKPAEASGQRDVPVIKRKLNGYVGFANLPKQWHRKSIRRGFSFNLMVVGAKGLGKSTLINTLFNKELYKLDTVPKVNYPDLEQPVDVKIDTVSAEIEENNVKLNLTVIDCPGFGENIDNTDVSWKPVVDEINHRFDQYLEQETKVNRSTIVDNRVHALLYFIEPTGHSLKPLDIEFMKQVHEKVNLIPVIARSDTLTEKEVKQSKQLILDDIKNQGITLFNPPIYDNDDDETVSATNEMAEKIPFAVVGSTNYIQTPDGRTVRGRSYPWGIIEVDNEEDCDFIKLRQLLIRNFMEELKETTAKVSYEKYRTGKLLKLGIQQDDSVFREFDPVLKQEEEKLLHEAKLNSMEAQMRSIFQQKVNREEKKLQETEADLFSKHKEMREKLLKQIKLLEEKKKELEGAQSKSQQSHKQQAYASPQVNNAPVKTRKGFLR
ncbi:DEKNAAC100538 [Brettanomyces naardenensis]|uniref:DEKNAAC100538 n=1 Tax=Brettanomyces naardenensis TaxID=13370 RepID=A0A448YFH6_BRENA|nr:DEKNAAC100538 [Brettanomyces naardenensis]